MVIISNIRSHKPKKDLFHICELNSVDTTQQAVLAVAEVKL